MSSNDPPGDKKDPQPERASPARPTPPPPPKRSTMPPPPSERRAASMPPPPPRRSVKPSGPPPAPPQPPRGQRLAGVFSVPPPAPTREPAAPEPAPAPPPAVESQAASVAAPPPAPISSPLAAPPPAPISSPVAAPPPAPISSPVAAGPEAPVEVASPPPAPEPTHVVAPPPPTFAPAPPVFPEGPAYVAEPAAPAFEPPSAAPVAPSLPPLPAGSPSLPPLSGTPSLPPPPSSRFAAAQARVINAVPPRWLELARQQPALWMVGAPVLFGTLLILLAAALAPTPVPRVAPRSDATSASGAAGTLPTPEAPSRTPTPEETTRAPADISAIEGKPADQLSVDEVLALHGARAQRKLEKLRTLSQKLEQSPESANDAETQAQLFHFVADADTAAAALVAMTHARAPIGADLLYEVWSNRSASPGTTELARALLQSPPVRAGTSPALAVAIELRGAERCEAIEAALPKAQSDGDRRSLPLLAKLNVKRGCGPDKKDDCFACLRSHTKQVLATANAVKKRMAPSYPARSAP